MTTIIDCVGSKWAGQNPDSVDDLMRMLRDHPLDPTFEEFGNFVQRTPELLSDAPVSLHGLAHITGNFFTHSYVFGIWTDDEPLIDRIEAAVRANQATPEYADAKTAVARRKADRAEHDRIQRERWERNRCNR